MRKVILGVATAALILSSGVAHADDGDGSSDPSDNTTNEVCGAFNLGVPPSDIASRLGTNDKRNNVWRSWQSTVWPILDGDCG